MSEPAQFVETLEYRRFVEFCESCRRYRYIGLCYGPPGVGKTLSATHYARWDLIGGADEYRLSDEELLSMVSAGKPGTALYTSSVISTPKVIEEQVSKARTLLHRIAREPAYREHRAYLEQQRDRYEKERTDYLENGNWKTLFTEENPPPIEPDYGKLGVMFDEREKAIRDPTSLILIDEADRLRTAGLEAVRDIFDRSHIGLVLIGMPGIEKRMARYPQFYSRIGFVHEYRPLSAAEIRRPMGQAWMPTGVHLPVLDDDAVAMIIRVTRGNFRLLGRLLAQTERIMEINALPAVTCQAIEAARESLVIGQAR